MQELFSDVEASLIMSIPLSMKSVADRLVWHFDKKGVYTVKNGYYVTRLSENIPNGASSSDGGVTRMRSWRAIWRARVPLKVRTFVWRLVKGILPTRTALARKVHISDLRCVFCQTWDESDLHLFKHCKALKQFWEISMLT